MSQKEKPNDLPSDVDDLDALTRPLIIESRLDRAEVIRRIADHAGVSDRIDHTTGYMTHAELAVLFRALNSHETRQPQTIERTTGKYALMNHLGTMYGFTPHPRQDYLVKSQLVHLLISLKTGDEPDPFQLPSDPERGDRQPTPASGGDTDG